MESTKTSLISPLADFFLVGGLSFFIILPFFWFHISLPVSVTLAVAFAYIINDPHFIHSYQLMYEDFRSKIAPRPDGFHRRYIFAGIIVPILFVLWFGYCIATQNKQALANTLNFMFLTVGWHYAKQAYGMMIVLSALRKIFYQEWQKKILLVNSYLIWITSWMLLNNNVRYLGYDMQALDIPNQALLIAGSLSFVTTLIAGTVFAVEFSRRKTIPVNALIGYFSAYIWLYMRPSSVELYTMIPVFHSLQYLPFVWRYKYNESRLNGSGGHEGMTLKTLATSPDFKPFRRFILIGLAIGLMAFHIVPWALDTYIPYNREIYGTGMFFLMIIIFINVHHYFIDNVIWRKENANVGKYLFAR